MTHRDPRDRTFSSHRRDRRRSAAAPLKRKRNRRMLSEALEQRQLLAGPDLIGIQPNEGSLINGGEILNVSPRELVFRFDDNTELDPETLTGIRITRAGPDGVFESATATSDLGTNGAAFVEFRAVESGIPGNGITVNLITNSRTGSRLPIVTTADRSVTIDLNSNPFNPTRIVDLENAVAGSAAASLIRVNQISGSSQTPIGTTVANGTVLTLTGANAAQAETDFATNGDVRVRIVSQLPGIDGLGTQIGLERRNFGGPANPVVVVNGQSILVQLNSAAGFESTAQDFIDAINRNPEAAALVQILPQEGDLETKIAAGTNPLPSITLAGVTDVVVEPGFVGLGDSPREVVFRFAEPLPNDRYQIDVLGRGLSALLDTDGEPFNDGIDETRQFSIDLAPQVVAVVPEPVRRNESGQLTLEVGKIEVHFNDDALIPSSAENPAFYQLIFTRDTVRNTDDFRLFPESVDYDGNTNIATLDFVQPLARILDPTTTDPTDFISGAARLRVGSNDPLPMAPVPVTVTTDPGDTFAEQGRLPFELTVDSTRQNSLRLTSVIDNVDRYELDLPGPDVPGTREIRPEDPSRLTRSEPWDYVTRGPDPFDSISVAGYNFAESWLGDDPTTPDHDLDRTYFNVISEQQKQRVREVMTMFSEYLGVNFVEFEGDTLQPNVISIAVGDLYGTNESEFEDAVSGPGGLLGALRDRDFNGIPDLVVLDFHDFDESDDDQFAGEFFRGAMFAVGQLLGYGYATDLPQPLTQPPPLADVPIFDIDTDIEPSFPSIVDITHGQYLHRPDSTDIDLYRFSLSQPGTLTVETMAERLAAPSLLDSALRLYRVGSDGSYELIAQNNDYFSNDSLIEIEADPGSYVVGVSAHGNTNYDPEVADSGFGGLSEGQYELILDFKPAGTGGIVDAGALRNPLDGDGDGRPGGVFNFWFVPADQTSTLFVDKAPAPTGGPLGSLNNPYREIDQALAAAAPGQTIRVVGNGGLDGRLETLEDNFSYQIGFDSIGLPLEDGSTIELPRGVRMVIDSGVILKMSRSRIAVGSTSPLIDVSNTSLQVLGTPSIISPTGFPARDETGVIVPGSVYFTSINDTSIGNGAGVGFRPPAEPGDWGGIDFRGDLDTADETRRDREDEGVFLNHIQHADLRFGGGQVDIAGRQVVVSPVDMAVTRVTVINSRITQSADAAIAATPDTFAETRFTEPFYQDSGAFTPDYSRIGPHVRGNTIIANSINGLFIRVVTRTGDVLERVNLPARIDDTDVVHALAENLIINGTPGGAIVQSKAPSSLLVQTTAVSGGDVPAGTYTYRLTNVDNQGVESAASAPTAPIALTAAGGVRLSQLPTSSAGGQFVARRLYRATIVAGTIGEFRLVAQLNAGDSTYTDRAAQGTTILATTEGVLRSRLDGSLKIDPGTVFKIDGARIETRFGSDFIAEGQPSLPIVFTSLEDQRYGAGGTFDTNDRGPAGELNPGDWGGIYVGHAGSASIDQAVIAGAGGGTRIEGGVASFNAVEVQQGDLRLTNTRFESNASGNELTASDRVGRGDNRPGTLFVRAAQPIVVNNTFIGGESAAISADVNSLTGREVSDPGRSTGSADRVEVVGNYGPLVQGNVLANNAINGMQVRGGELTTAGVWDDVDVVHVVSESIEIPNRHIFGGLRLQSDARGSLVVKFESSDEDVEAGEVEAGIVVGGSLLTAAGEFRDISDRIGGSLQIVGHPDFPVVLTALADDTAGAGFTLGGIPGVDTNNDGIAGTDLAQSLGLLPDRDDEGETGSPGLGVGNLPTGPEVDNGTLIDNDVPTTIPGFFEAGIADGNDVLSSGVTVRDIAAGQTLVDQDYIFQYSTFVTTADGVVPLAGTTITQEAELIADDVVESRGTFAGTNGTVEWIATSRFLDGTARLDSRLEFNGGDNPLGDIQVFNYLDEDVEGFTDDILVTVGTPGEADFRAFTLDGPRRVGFSHGGIYVPDGVNLVNATYDGWAADQFNQLQTAILDGTQAFSIPGEIDLDDLPQAPDLDFGVRYGPEDITTAFAWSVDPAASTATVTSFLELLASDPVVTPPTPTFDAGLWNGIVIREGADDRNVAAFAEQEPLRTAFIDDNDFVDGSNEIPGLAQFLGELAPDDQSGDENRRLGFIVNGAIARRSDLDVYSFIAESGTEVWIDIDKSSSQLDTVVELIDANGVTLAANNSSILAETNGLALYPNSTTASPRLNLDATQPLTPVSDRIPVQEISFSESIYDATGGTVALTLVGTGRVVPVDVGDLQLRPAQAIGRALDSFPELAGSVRVTTLSQQRDQPLLLQVSLDGSNFVGRTVPTIDISTVGVMGASVTASVVERMTGSQLQDEFTINPKDAGMRIVLPGEFGTRNQYHVRVRSSNTNDPLNLAAVVDTDQVRDGKSMGAYELQIRLGETDEHAGTQIRSADVRFATDGLHIIGQPTHSPLTGEERETTDDNDSLENAQRLGIFGETVDETAGEGGPLQSDRLAKSVAGKIESFDDVDWYQFDVDYRDLVFEDAIMHLATVFDLDYAGGFGRADMALYVFDSAGGLIYAGGDSNIADDLPPTAESSETTDLSRGSATSDDPYIGAAELLQGTYYVAVAHQQNVPLGMDQFFNADSANPLLRLEPIDSVTRIAEDRIDSLGSGVLDEFGRGTADAPQFPVLFDDESIVPYTLDDVVLYVNSGTQLHMVNPFTGQDYGPVGNFGVGEDQDELLEVAFRSNGELFAYNVPDGIISDLSLQYFRIDTGNADLSGPLSLGAGVVTFGANVNPGQDGAPDTYTAVASNSGLTVEAIAIASLSNNERAYLVANRTTFDQNTDIAGADYQDNILYRFDPTDGNVIGPIQNFGTGFAGTVLSGAATSPREVGQIRGLGSGELVTGVELVNNMLYGVTNQGTLVSVTQAELSTFGARQVGSVVGPIVDANGDPVSASFTALRAGPLSFRNPATGQFDLREILFGITAGGDIYAFNTSGVLQPVFANGQSVISTDIGDARGLDFSILGYNLWHATGMRSGDEGHGIPALPNGARGGVTGGNSLAFNYEDGIFQSNYPGGEDPVVFDTDGEILNPRQDGAELEASFNMPGGARGVVQSNNFSLQGYAAADQPMLYFNYFLDADEGERSDVLRVYVTAPDGAQHLVATNNLAVDSDLISAFNDEFDDPPRVGQYDDNIDVETQQLYDSTGSWRQARVPLAAFAGLDNLSLRIEFSTAGTFDTNAVTLRVPPSDQLIDGETFIIGGETFSIDFETGIAMPSGAQLAASYEGNTEPAFVSVNGQQFALDDGTRTISSGQIAVDLLEGQSAGTTLANLSGARIAAAVAAAVESFLVQSTLTDGLQFADAADNDPGLASAEDGTNDLLTTALPLPYTGGPATLVGQGQIGHDSNFGGFDLVPNPGLVSPANEDDVDLLSLNAVGGARIDVSLSDIGLPAISSVIRFFDRDGNELTPATSTVNSASLIVPESGRVLIGISGTPNMDYDPTSLTDRLDGSVGQYEATIAITPVSAVPTFGNLVEFTGINDVAVSSSDLFAVESAGSPTGVPVSISRAWDSNRIAAEVQQVLAGELAAGELSAFPRTKSSITIQSGAVMDSGPFARESDRWGQQFGAGQLEGARNNDFEGVYLDDFIIGLAERGEIVTGAEPITDEFTTDQRPFFASPADPVSDLGIGEYQLEIRDASEYLSSRLAEFVLDDELLSSQVLTRHSNVRLSDAYSITALPADQLSDGATFTISDGRTTVTFEFNLTESGGGVAPGNVEIPFTLRKTDAVTGRLRPETAAEVATNIVRAINRADVQALITVPAAPADGLAPLPTGSVEDPNNPRPRSTSPVVHLFAEIEVSDPDDTLAAINHNNMRGDDNRSREGQGVILVENSRFLRNSQYGIKISHGPTALVNGVETDSVVRYPRNLVDLNVDDIKPGVVVQSNVVAFNEGGGIQINGIDPTADETSGDPVPYDRIVNNTIIGGQILAGVGAPAREFNGLLFDSGRQAFADEVVSYVPDAGGDEPALIHQEPEAALGPPQVDGRGVEPADGTTSVSLGVGGTLTLRFVDNLLTGSGNADPDLVVFENGEVESVRVEISRDGVTFFDVGILGGLTNRLDIDSAGFGPQDRFAFVRLTDLRQGSLDVTSLGADIDAVGALSSAAVERFNPAGTGVELTGNAGPILMNNIIANTELGLDVPVENTFPILEANTYYRNTENVPDGVGLGRAAQAVPDAAELFFGAGELVFVPAAGSTIIDSSTDSLEDRPGLSSVKNPLGLAPSPVIAPRLDVNGQLRVDDPDVEGPGGVGERVFKDRGAADRGDQVGPRIVLLSPQAPNLGTEAGTVAVSADLNAPQFFEVQLIDGLAPADIVPGTGIDDRTVSSSSVLLIQDGEVLVEGVDYRFGYNPSTNVFRLTPIAGVWEQDSTYVIRMVDAQDAIVQATDGSQYDDGVTLRIVDSLGVPTRFEYETGITLAPVAAELTNAEADGVVVNIFDGEIERALELDNDNLFDDRNIIVQIPEEGDIALAFTALAEAVNALPLNLTATAAESGVQFLGSNPLASVTTESDVMTTSGAIGTSFGFGVRVPNDGLEVGDSIVDGATFVIRRGAVTEVTFEFDANGVVDTEEAVAVNIAGTTTIDGVADAIVRAVAGTGLGLNPQNSGFGQVLLGGDENYSIDTGDSGLLVSGTPGQGPTMPIVIPIDNTAEEVAVVIADAIDAAELPGVTTTVFGTRVFLEGTQGISGIGSAATVTVTDLVGNEVQSTQASGRAELSIFVGGGFDFGDAPYPETSGDGAARHRVDSNFALALPDSQPTVTPDNEPRLIDQDSDNGFSLNANQIWQPGFTTTFTVGVVNESGQPFQIDAWFDWNRNNSFEASERLTISSTEFFNASGTVSRTIVVPSTANAGDSYLRMRLWRPQSGDTLGPGGDALVAGGASTRIVSGEVEDHRISIVSNRFQQSDTIITDVNGNPILDSDGNNVGRADVNDSGFVSAIDALQIINALRRNNTTSVNLAVEPLPDDLPEFPDPDGNGSMTAFDALYVVNALGVINNWVSGEGSAEGEAPPPAGLDGSYVHVGDGVMASAATAASELTAAADAERAVEASESTIAPPPNKISVFDSAATVQLDSIVDLLADDEQRADDQNASRDVDEVFAQL